jgi:hypothetical protein
MPRQGRRTGIRMLRCQNDAINCGWIQNIFKKWRLPLYWSHALDKMG